MEVVKYALAPASGVAFDHQILIYEGEKLDDTRVLADYGLPHARPPASTLYVRALPAILPSPRTPLSAPTCGSWRPRALRHLFLRATSCPPRPSVRSLSAQEGNAIFMFNRAMLARDAQPPPPIELSPAEFEAPTAPELPAVQLRKGASPLVSALLDYRTQFFAHLFAARAYRDVGSARLDSIHRALSRQRVQAEALRAALANLRVFSLQLSERYARFRERLGEQLRHKQVCRLRLCAACARMPPALARACAWRGGGVRSRRARHAQRP